MYKLKKIGKVFTSKFVGTGPSSYKKKEFTGLWSHKGWETLLHSIQHPGAAHDYSTADTEQVSLAVTWLIYLKYIHFRVLVRPPAVIAEVPIVSCNLLCGNASVTLYNTPLLYPPNMSNFQLSVYHPEVFTDTWKSKLRWTLDSGTVWCLNNLNLEQKIREKFGLKLK